MSKFLSAIVFTLVFFVSVNSIVVSAPLTGKIVTMPPVGIASLSNSSTPITPTYLPISPLVSDISRVDNSELENQEVLQADSVIVEFPDVILSSEVEPDVVNTEPLNIGAKSQNTLNVAVASNFSVAALHVAQLFTEKYGIQVNIASASTATLYKQIIYGAPFDLFLSADQKHVQLLLDAAKVKNQQGFVYAQGQLVFWKPRATETVTLVDLFTYDQKLAIANPIFAPYGIAAQEALTFIDKWQSIQYVKGNNINQAYQFVDSGNVPAGLVSYAAVLQKQQKNYVIIPQRWYQPIQQVGIILNNKHLRETRLFREFLLSDNIQNYIKSQGYN
jgi:molybdate transport system substrate-binding protein